MSVGYDLAGIQTPKVAGFIDAMRNASAEIERLRPEIAADPSGVFAGLPPSSSRRSSPTPSHCPRSTDVHLTKLSRSPSI